MFVLISFMFVVPTFAEEPVLDERNVEIQAAPVATLSPVKWSGNANTQYFWTVGTTSSARPYKFYFDPGDGTDPKSNNTWTNSTSWTTDYTYNRTTVASRTYTTAGWVYDQNNMSEKKYGTATMRSF